MNAPDSKALRLTSARSLAAAPVRMVRAVACAVLVMPGLVMPLLVVMAGTAAAQQTVQQNGDGWRATTTAKPPSGPTRSSPSKSGPAKSKAATAKPASRPDTASDKSTRRGSKTGSKSGSKTVKAADGAAPKLDAAAAQQRVEAGIIALNSGSPAVAISSISSALQSGALPAAQTARALYYRGIGYRKDAKPAQAIADLTRALWLKNGLDAKLRQDALAQRSAAYREAGLPDQAEASTTPVARRPSTDTETVQPSAGNVQTVQVGASSGGLGSWFGGGLGSLFGSSGPSATGSLASATPATAPALAPAMAPAATSRPSAAPRVSSAVAIRGTRDGGAASSGPASSGPAAPVPAASKPWSSVTKVTSVRTQPRPEAKRAAAGTTSSPVPAQPPAGPAQRRVVPTARPATTTTTAALARGPASAGAASGAKGAAAASAARSPVAAVLPRLSPAVAGGAYGVQVAAVRTAEQAKEIVARVQQRYGAALGGRAPLVEQTAVGNLGTIYRVRIGSIATAEESNGLCQALKRDGMACMIYTQ